MKKITRAFSVFCLAALLAAPVAVFAQETVTIVLPALVLPANETNLSAGFVFGNTIEHGDNIASDADNIYFGSPGVTVGGYSFWNHKNIGMFFLGSFMFPVAGDDTYDFQGNWLIGPAFRVNFKDKLTWQTGVGVGGTGLVARYDENGTDYLRSVVNFGLGADTGLKFDITDKFFIKGGVNVAWSFLGWTNVREKSARDWGETNKNIMDNWSFSANPYISFGINVYSPKRQILRPEERPRLGKPPREVAAK